MNLKILSLAVALVVLPAGRAQSADASPGRAAIQPLMDEQLLAANAHDTDRFLATYLHDPTLVFAYNGTIITGWDNVRAGQLKAWKNGQSDIVYSNNGEARFAVLSPEAVVVTEPIAAIRTLPDGRKSRGEFVVTTVWKKTADGWRAVQVHESTARK